MALRASAPLRVCDNGGWTDTWFGGPGRVFSVAVEPRMEVVVTPTRGLAPHGRSPLVEAAMEAYPPPMPLDVAVISEVPPGSGMGTSGAAAVALVAALLAARGEDVRPLEVALAAHQVESGVLGAECGIQDHASAALGGINLISVDSYPRFEMETLPWWPELAELLSVVYLGQPHDSSSLHREVIERCDPGAFERLRRAALAARDAAAAADLAALGAALVENTAAQADLHPALVGRDALVVIEAARRFSLLGWKVNGAGGDGGSVTVLSASSDQRARFEEWVSRTERYRLIRVSPTMEGLRVEGSL